MDVWMSAKPILHCIWVMEKNVASFYYIYATLATDFWIFCPVPTSEVVRRADQEASKFCHLHLILRWLLCLFDKRCTELENYNSNDVNFLEKVFLVWLIWCLRLNTRTAGLISPSKHLRKIIIKCTCRLQSSAASQTCLWKWLSVHIRRGRALGPGPASR